MEFIGRKRELQALDHFYEIQEAGLMVIFGRRRVGKTSLLAHFMNTRQISGGFYWVATQHNTAYQLRDFSQALFTYDPRFNAPPSPDFTFRSWEEALLHLATIVEQAAEPQFIVIDEFTYLVRNDPALASVLQKVWDHRLSKLHNLRLVLTGSLVGMMMRDVISYQAPLYGRATSILRLRPLPYAALIELFAEQSADERVAIYAVTGGVPAYLNLFAHQRSFSSALHKECLVPGSILWSDPAIILHEQLDKPQSYESVLSAIATGFHSWMDIAKMAGIPDSSIAYYLQVLEALELIERRDPIYAPPSNKRGQYYLRDHFLQFYYRFLVPHLSKIERGFLDVVVDQITQDLRAFVGTHTFEELCRDWTVAAGVAGQLDFDPEEIGSFWQQIRGESVQLDVVAGNRRLKKLLIGEAKWGKEAVSRAVLTDLIKRSERMPQVVEGWNIQYVLFSRTGFTEAAAEMARELNVRLVTLQDIEQVLSATYQF